jgi:hypothetical protein
LEIPAGSGPLSLQDISLEARNPNKEKFSPHTKSETLSCGDCTFYVILQKIFRITHTNFEDFMHPEHFLLEFL